MKCPSDIVQGQRDSLEDCQRYCGRHGAKRLTHYSKDYCRCCTDSSELVSSGDYGVGVYKLEGNCIDFQN